MGIECLSTTTLLLADRLWWPIAGTLAIAFLIVACIRGFQRHYLNAFHQPVMRGGTWFGSASVRLDLH